MRFKLAIQFTAICLLGIAAAVTAQQPGQQGQGQQGGRGRGGFGGGGGGPPGFGGFMVSRMGLLRNDAVRKELELADEQTAEIEKVNEEIRAKYPNAFGGRGGGGGPPGGGQGGRRGGNNNNNNNGASLSVPTQWYFVVAQDPNQQQGQGQRGRGGFGQQQTPEERAEQLKQRQERTREENAKLAEILLPNQLKRLNEIYIQQAGPGALLDDEIAKTVGISDAQKAKLTEVSQQNQEAIGALVREMFQGGGGGGGDRDANRAKMDEARKAGEAKMLAVLNADQQKKFEELKGKPFTMPEGGFGRGGGPGGGAPGGNRGRGGTKGGTNNN